MPFVCEYEGLGGFRGSVVMGMGLKSIDTHKKMHRGSSTFGNLLN